MSFPERKRNMKVYLVHISCCSFAKSCHSLWLHGLQHASSLCPSLFPGVCSKPCPQSWWCNLTILSSANLFSFCHQSFPASGSFPWVSSSYQVPKYWSFRISPSNEKSRLISFRTDWFNLLAVQGTLKILLQHHSSRASVLWPSTFFMVQLSHP